jgi:hypothetical protein
MGNTKKWKEEMDYVRLCDRETGQKKTKGDDRGAAEADDCFCSDFCASGNCRLTGIYASGVSSDSPIFWL